MALTQQQQKVQRMQQGNGGVGRILRGDVPLLMYQEKDIFVLYLSKKRILLTSRTTEVPRCEF